MCAIAGMVGLPISKDIVEDMLATMKRRGPDENCVYRKQEATLLHSRLTVIDPAGGKQPMSLKWGNEIFTIVYNGELYNTAELRKELLTYEHRFSGHSDTEVLLHAYAQWGEECLQKCNGIFAFAVWQEHSRELFLARDRMGVKPLFYKQHQNGFLFASEMKTILRYPTVEAKLDIEGISELMLLGPGRIPGSGVLQGIHELEPGCCGTFTHGKFSWSRYWMLRDREHTQSFTETAEQVRALVMDSIHRQMVSDVPLGTFLSGGLDSSLITAVCAEQRIQAGESLQTFSLDYVDNDKYFVPGKFQPNSDTHYIHIMQTALQTEHQWTVLTPEDLTAALEDATSARDLPGMADVDFSLLAFCKEIRKKVTVALSGECADEIFGGYPWYRDPEVRAIDGFPWAQNTKIRESFLVNQQVKQNAADFVQEQYLMTVRESDVLPGTSAQERRMKEMVNLNHRWFMQTLLDRKDRMSMYSGLEVRVPFCDYRIAEYLYGVPWEFKDWGGYEKGLLRHAMRGVLPEEILWRKKSPYPKTHHPKYRELVSEQLRLLLLKKNAPIFQIVDRKALEELLTTDYAWPWYGQLMKEPQTIAYMLQLNFWLEHYKVSVV